MNFDVGDSRKLGNLNDIYKKRTRHALILPNRKFDLQASATKYESDRKMLAQLPHYMSYGLVICNPQLWSKFVSQADALMLERASTSYQTLRQVLKSRLEYDDGNYFLKRWDPATKKMVPVPPDSLLDESEGKDEYVVVPKFLALTIFGPDCIDPSLPRWLSSLLVCRMLDVPQDSPMDKIFLALCTHSRPPDQVFLREQLQKFWNKQLPLTRPLRLELTLRDAPLNQTAVVAFCVYQFRKAVEGFCNGKPTHQFAGILVMPCGVGKTKMGLTISHNLYEDKYSELPHNDFGFVEHTASSAEQKPVPKPVPSGNIMNFFAKSTNTPSQQPVASPKPVEKSPNDNTFSDWLKNHPDIQKQYLQESKRTGILLWIADHDDLLEQAATSIDECLPGAVIGLLQQKSRPNPKKCDVVVASIRTIVKQSFPADYFANFSMVIFDEAHRNIAKYFRKVFSKVGCIPLMLCLTATPRNDALRMLGGPILVSATRPFVEQQHVVVALAGVSPETRPIQSKQSGYAGKKKDNNASYSKKDDFDTAMCQDMAVNHARNALMIDIIFATCHNLPVPNRWALDQATRMPSPRSDHYAHSPWPTMFEKVWQNAKPMDYKTAGTSFEWRTTQKMNIAHEPTKSNRVPIIYAKHVPHLILLQHMFAQKWLHEAKQKPEFAGKNLQIVRTGLRQLAVVNLDAMTEDQKRRLKWIGGRQKAEFCASSVPSDTSPAETFDVPFWQAWFKKYPLCKRMAVAQDLPFLFKNDGSKSAKKKQTGAESAETKKYTSSDWMYKSQYFWTPVYYPIPSAVKEAQDQEPVKKKRSKKRAKPSDEEEGDGDEEMEDSTGFKLFCRKVLQDTRPPLERTSGQLLATFGLYMGIGSYPIPAPLLSDTRISPGTPHNLEALCSDFVFANYAVASTGIDRDTIDTTIMAVPYKDVEQLHGRALRICATKQQVLHLEFAEVMSIYPAQVVKHMEGMLQQQISSQLYLVSPK